MSSQPFGEQSNDLTNLLQTNGERMGEKGGEGKRNQALNWPVASQLPAAIPESLVAFVGMFSRLWVLWGLNLH